MLRHFLPLGALLQLGLTVAGQANQDVLSRIPLYFEERDGAFLARTGPHTVEITATSAQVQPGVITMRLRGANPRAAGEGIGLKKARVNYIMGSDRRKWRMGLRTFDRVRFAGVYPGVDLLYYSNAGRLEYDFVVAPGANTSSIALRYQGADRLEMDGEGNLLVHSANGSLLQKRPLVRQGSRQWRGAYRIAGGRVAIDVGVYDHRRELTIDPVLIYSTYFGGSDREPAFSGLGSQSQIKFGGIAVDPQGCAYIAGTTFSADLPVRKALQGARPGPGTSAFVAKFDPTGSQLIYATYLGGSANRERGFDIAVNARGEAYVVGRSLSADFPTVNALQPVQRGGEDGFLAKLSADGASLVFSTFIGGSAGDDAYTVALDRDENIYLAGETSSIDFPVRNANQAGQPGGVYDSWLAKLNPNASAILFATYVGGNADDDIEDLAVDGSGNVFVTGYTSSANFPLRNPVQGTYGGGQFDAFVMKFSSEGSLLASTFIGGSQAEAGVAVGVGPDGSPVIVGPTYSTDLAVSTGALRASLAGPPDGFVVKLEPSAARVSFATYFGGSEKDAVLGVAIDGSGRVVLAGQTESDNLTLGDRPPLLPYKQGTDAFAAVLSPDGSSVAWGTFLGGSSTDSVYSLAVDGAGGIYIYGATSSPDYPTLAPFQAAFGGLIDAFVTKIGEPAFASVSAASFTPTAPLAPASIAAGYGQGLAPATAFASAVPLPTALAETSVKVRDSQGIERLAPLFFVSPGQINYLIPEGTALGYASVTVVSRGQTAATGTASVVAVSPGVFSANSDGRGAAAAVALRYAADNTQTWDYAFQCGSTLGSCVPKPIDLGPDTDRVYLQLFGTGIRGVSSTSAMTARVGGVDVVVYYAGPQGGFVGLDQVNIRLDRSLRGRGEVDVNLTVEGKAANPVKVNIR